MATPSGEDFVERFPVFTASDSDMVDQALADSADLLDESAWGDNWTLAVMLDAAHTLVLEEMASASVLAGMSGASGPVQSVSAAGVSTSFAGMPAGSRPSSRDWYNKTIYGQRFLRLRDATIPPGDLCL
jgi:hypothetical protein